MSSTITHTFVLFGVHRLPWQGYQGYACSQTEEQDQVLKVQCAVQWSTFVTFVKHQKSGYQAMFALIKKTGYGIYYPDIRVCHYWMTLWTTCLPKTI